MTGVGKHYHRKKEMLLDYKYKGDKVCCSKEIYVLVVELLDVLRLNYQ